MARQLPQTVFRVLNTGADTYFGIEGSSAGSFFPGSLAYSSVIYSNTAIQHIIGGTPRMSVDTNGNVGIGIRFPQSPLHLTSENFSNILRISGSGSTNSLRFSSGSGYASLRAGTTDDEILVINHSTGNVGIKNINPTEKLDVVGNGKFTGTVSGANAVSSNQLVPLGQLRNDEITLNKKSLINYFQSGGDFTFKRLVL